MNKRQSRIFAIVATGLAAVAFLGLTLYSHARFDDLTNAADITPEVTHGKDVWHKYNCINCHTLFGEGAYYAPDLTKIAQHRGEAYLKAYMRDPSQFYDEQRHRRLMPTQNLSEVEIANLVKFLDWVSKVDNQGWPPRPILVAGGSAIVAAQGTAAGAAEAGAVRPVRADSDPRAIGENLFGTAVPVCTACHSLQPGVQLAGPSMAGMAERAAQTIASADYTGSATDVEGYIRESIVSPSAHLVPGAMFSAEGTSFMPNTYPESLTEEQVDQLVAFLGSMK
ncbi:MULTISPECIES: cytochrome c [unclassified Luteimonas]|uniref:c-type cytochrome n=1 Tax=unclassified Luteimonas TaxID=2629088 RepID=UPI0015FF5A45|nr:MULTISPECIES: cytochrome c [unclassified Luteimonas]MBB1471668.1 cytochrome c [Luteimonas sp. MC1782]MBB6599591.1 cytochrome c [Luteimonas sp. MC1825]QOC87284.1 cytochrome c [Luteimonas sp. MC1825]